MTIRILVGDCRVRLREFPNNFFHTCVTSWPFWGLRDYGIEPTIWGGDPECEHVWGDHQVGRVTGGGDRPPDSKWPGGPSPDSQTVRSFCQLCGAWLGNFGLEPTPELYVQHGVEISREVRRVLRDDGSMWLNLGDCHMGSGQGWQKDDSNSSWKRKWLDEYGVERPPTAVYTRSDLKPKDLVGIPWACAFALRDDGWYLRQAIPWIKDNPMPGSQDDRPTTSHEYLFLFSKKRYYYYDKVAIFEPTKEISVARAQRRERLIEREGHGAGGKQQKSLEGGNGYDHAYAGLANGRSGGGCDPSGRNRRTADWWCGSLDLLIKGQRDYLAHLEHIKAQGGMLLAPDGEPLALKVNPEGFSGDHYAVFPTRLVEPCVKAGTSERGACPECGGPWERVVDKSITLESGWGKSGHFPKDIAEAGKWGGKLDKRLDFKREGHDIRLGPITHTTTLGFRPTCSCYDDRYRTEFPKARSPRKRWQQDMADRWWPRVRQRPGKDDWPTVPCVVLDPMGGAGTTAMVADRLGRDAVSIDIKLEYGQMSQDRIVEDAGPMFAQVTLEERHDRRNQNRT